MIKYKPINSLKSPRFSGIKTFMRLPQVTTTDDIDFAIVGIPFDTCASYRVGSRFGPSSIREMSCLGAKPYNPELEVGIFDYCSGVDYGDLASVPGYIEDSFELITEGLVPLFEKNVIPVSIGGDHSVTLPELRACAGVNGAVALIHFDAHYDTIPEYFGKPYNHGTPFYHAAKEGLVDTSHSIQIGIRENLYGAEDLENSKGLGYEVLKAVDAHKMTSDEIVAQIKKRVGNKKAFLTFDIDFLDPASAPGTGTPVIGGFNSTQALEIIRGLADLNIIGYDMVEVAPQYDPSGITPITASGLICEFLGHIAYKKKHNIVF
ncbi:MAG: agmatinase [Clostridiales bacterium]